MTLRQLRESKYLMQLEVAEKAGVAPSTISKWERGLTQPDLRNMRQLAVVFGVTPDDIKKAVEETTADANATENSSHWEQPGKDDIANIQSK
ncbi:MAG: helix-turn-helix transcriptional regulator [Ktedonobacterales bacterium]|nr:helix-turn-helix transcriptional regulator [Ktedonobacterales bacterium]